MWLKRKYIINIKGMLSLDRTSIIFLLLMTLIIFGSGILLSELDNFIKKVLPMSAYWLETLNTISGEDSSPWKGILAIAVTAPIVEEIIFRGILLKGFLKHYSVRKSIILSALLFGMIHMNPWQFVSAFAGGLILGWWYVKTNSILTPIFGHALNNGLSFILTAIGLSIPGYNTAYSVAIHQPIWFDLLGVILLALGIVWLVNLFNARQVRLERTV
jgi:membrane protease YdiL (CAAX protease family)